MSPGHHVAGIARALLLRPDLWRSALGAALRLVPHKWWRGQLMPSREYLDYRGIAVYGIPLSRVPAHEFIHYLEWCKAFPGPVR